MDGVAFKKTFSYAGFEMQPKRYENLKIALLNVELELKAEKQSAHSDWVQSVAFSPDGKTIVSGSGDKTLEVWDAGAWTLIPLNPKSYTVAILKERGRGPFKPPDFGPKGGTRGICQKRPNFP